MPVVLRHTHNHVGIKSLTNESTGCADASVLWTLCYYTHTHVQNILTPAMCWAATWPRRAALLFHMLNHLGMASLNTTT